MLKFQGRALSFVVPFWLLDTVIFTFIVISLFCKFSTSCFVSGFLVWRGTECHKLPLPVICNLRWKMHWVAHRLLTSRHTHSEYCILM